MTNPTIPYFIQYWNLSYADLQSRDFRMAIMDDDHTPLTPEQLEELHLQDKKLVTYLSIGEVEFGRKHVQAMGWSTEQLPQCVVEKNVEWGSYRVAFWEKEWQDLTVSQAKALVEKGYDGLFLDVVDVYGMLKSKFPDRNVEQDMIDFVRLIAHEARKINPDALIIPNNGLTLLNNPAYLEVIDGVAKESTFYSAHRETEDSPVVYKVPEWKKWDLEYIIPVAKAPINKFVLAIEYPVDKEMQLAVMKEATEHNFVPFIGTYMLDELPDANAEYFKEHPFDYRDAHFLPMGLSPMMWGGIVVVLLALIAVLAFIVMKRSA